MSKDYPYDHSIEVGDYITTYHNGIFRLVSIEFRAKDGGKSYNPLFHYNKVLTATMKPVKSDRIQICDASYCERLTQESIREMKEAVCAQYDWVSKRLFGATIESDEATTNS